MSLEIKLIAILVLVAGLLLGLRHAISEHDASVLASQALKQQQADQAQEQRRTQAQAEIANESQRMATRARDDALLAADSHVRLSERVAALGNGLHPPSNSAGQAAPTATDLLADVQRRIDEAAGQLAIAADDRYTAGLSCQRKYDALK